MNVRPRLALAGVVLALVASACGGDGGLSDAADEFGQTTVTFSVGLDQAEIPAIQTLLRRFQDRRRDKLEIELVSRFRNQPRVVVNLLTSLDAAGIDRTIEQDLRTGKPTVHLFARDNVGLEVLVQEGLVEDLSEVPLPGDVIPKLVPQRFDGKQFFLPFRPNVRLAYVNERRLAQAGVGPPRSVEDLGAVAQRLRAVAGAPKVTLSLAAGEPAAVTVSEWILSFGGNPLVLNDAGSVRAFQFLQALWDEGLVARESLFAKFDTEIGYLARGTSWLAENWSFTSAQLARKGMLGDFGVYSGWDGPAGPGHVIGGDVLGVPKGVRGRQREAALELARFLMSHEAQGFLAEANAWPSIGESSYAEVGAEQKETFAAIQPALEHGWAGRSVGYWCHVRQRMNEAVERILVRHQPVVPALDELHAEVELARQQGAECPPPD